MIDNMDYTEETMGVAEIDYPGSHKGPKPEDDIEFFLEWS